MSGWLQSSLEEASRYGDGEVSPEVLGLAALLGGVSGGIVGGSRRGLHAVVDRIRGANIARGSLPRWVATHALGGAIATPALLLASQAMKTSS